MKSSHLLRQLEKLDEAIETLDQAIVKFPTYDKLHMMKGQINEDRSNIPAAREAYSKGVKACPKSIPLWLLSSRLEEKAGITIKARALLERARMQNPKNDQLWAESIKVEERAGSAAQARTMLARAQQECPASGLLWNLAIWMSTGSERKGKSVDAVRKSNDDPVVICAIARLFWAERKIEKARSWFNRGVKADKDNGDIWAWWLNFERQHGDANKVSQVSPLHQLTFIHVSVLQERENAVIAQCIAAEPKHGETWPSVAKDMKNIGKTTAEILELVALKLK